ncbi:MAG: agmatinase [Desulfitobacteriia bacterium]|jgi:agmatinase
MLEKKLFACLEQKGVFIGATTSYKEAETVLLGAPMDFTATYQPGSRNGPLSIRNVSIALEDYSPYLDKSLEDYRVCDLGDLGLPFGNVQASLKIIEEATEILLQDKKFPIFLGGEHLVSLPIIKSFINHFSNLVIIHFDAHADLREDYYGQEYSHSTVMRKIADILGPRRIYQFGIRSGHKEEFEFAKDYTRMFPFKVVEPLKDTLPELKGKPIYVSLDIDVVDPAFAPGTGTQEPGGCSAAEIIEAIHLLKNLNIVGLDIVEVCPQLDYSERTAILAAKLVRESILSFSQPA